jgi:ABC-2 type transport system ATP-binding protein
VRRSHGSYARGVGEVVIKVDGLRKHYGAVEAVRGISFEVERGEVFGFIGPNGSGKTTTIEILEGYRSRTAGDVSVLGVDPQGARTRSWRERVGLVLQECELEPTLTVIETLGLFASFYEAPRGVDETIQLVGLVDKRDARVGALSGGQRRRVDVAVGMIGDPELIFLDEPTTGFDPSARHEAWNMIESLKQLGKTVFLTTHYMDEAEHLADRVAILRRGEIVAQGAPDDLGARLGAVTEIRFGLSVGGIPAEELEGVLGEKLSVAGNSVTVATTDSQRVLRDLIGWADARAVRLVGLEVRRPTLEDVFLQVTGEGARE